MRLFIAIAIPEEIKDYLVKIQQGIDKDIAKIKLVNKDQMHLTLKFLGEIEENKINDIKNKLKGTKFNPFKTKLTSLGVFPDENYIRVVWIGLKDHENIIKLQKQVDDSLTMFRKDKKFHPHLTLARVKFVKEKEKFIELIKSIKIEEKEFDVNEFKLIKSTLTKERPVYEVLEEFKS
jgi:2'-5' RNA ligase